MGIFSGILDLLSPPKCVFCRKILAKGERGTCSACKSSLPYTGKSGCIRSGEFFTVCVSPLYYTGAVRDSILRFKFGGREGYDSEYGRILAECIDTNLKGRYDLITYVPVSRKRRNERGYDQAWLLACATALELNDVAAQTLRKDTDIPAQSTLKGYDSRKANVSGVYSVVDSELVEDKRILIIDDIITSGATLSECARTLLTAGAKEVICATLARADEPQ